MLFGLGSLIPQLEQSQNKREGETQLHKRQRHWKRQKQIIIHASTQ